jgi:arginine decarboxylase
MPRTSWTPGCSFKRCEYQPPEEIERRMARGEDVVSATFVTPYPPGFPVLVPGQCFSEEILAFMSSLDTPEVHGYRPELGYRIFTDAALERATRTLDQGLTVEP